jgi:metal-sulfur cluster biosynthetic enzyme
MTTAKENANPQIFQVEKGRAHTQHDTLDWSHLGSFQTPSDDFDDGWTISSDLEPPLPTTVEDMAILKALVDSSRATDGKGVRLLGRAGLKIPHSLKKANRGPVFVPVEDNECGGEVLMRSSDTTKKRREQQRLLNVRSSPIKPRNDNEVTREEIFDIIRNIQDPEHPHSLEELGVVSLEQVELLSGFREGSNNTFEGGITNNSATSIVNVRFTPTIPHCSMATLIGLCIRVKLWRSLPPQFFKVNVQIEPGTHASEMAINKQLRDKERVCAALENKHLAGVVNNCIRNGMNA